MGAQSDGPRSMQGSLSVDLHLYKAIVLSSNSCQTQVVPKTALFPRMVALLKVFCEKNKSGTYGSKSEKFWVQQCLAEFFIAALLRVFTVLKWTVSISLVLFSTKQTLHPLQNSCFSSLPNLCLPTSAHFLSKSPWSKIPFDLHKNLVKSSLSFKAQLNTYFSKNSSETTPAPVNLSFL